MVVAIFSSHSREPNVKDLILRGSSDTTVSEAVIRNLPKGSYGAVFVNRCDYNFAGLGMRSARVITLYPSGSQVDKLINQVRALFFGFPRIKTPYNGNALSEYILGINQSEAAAALLREACREKRKIYLYVSQDGAMMECSIQDRLEICVLL